MSTPAPQAGAEFVDLHVHTTHSDGRLAPARVVEEAARRGLAAIAITDHDVVTGIAEAVEAGQRWGIEIIPGIELTADYQGRLAHVLGYFVDPCHPQLVDALARAREQVGAHARLVLDTARQQGIEIDERALARYRGRYLSGATVILGMVEQGVLRRSPLALRLLRLASQQPRPFKADEAIRLVHRAGGVAVLAHPVRLHRDRPLLEAEDLRPLVESGLDGIEAWQIVHTPSVREHYIRLAESLGLVPTGGSDCHGPRSSGMRLGSQSVPQQVLTRLRQRWRLRPGPSARS